MSRTHAPSGWIYRTHDPEEVHDRIWAGFSGGTGWDIGANEGQSVDRMVQSFEHVVALEPASESFRILQREWGLKPGVTLLNLAAGDESGMVPLSVRSTPIRGGQLVSPDLPETGWHGEELYRRNVPCITLDELAREYGFPDFVKIDVEGYEERVLRGAADVIKAGCDWLVEYHSRELLFTCMELLGDEYTFESVPNEESDGNGWLLVRTKRVHEKA